MDAYYFSKLNAHTKEEHFEKYSGRNVTVCFDLEDSIGELPEPHKTSELKRKRRILIYNFFRSVSPNNRIKFGIRINNSDSKEQMSDIEMISGLNVPVSIFIPKINSIAKFRETLQLFEQKKIICRECVPVVESKKGMENLKDIINVSSLITSAAFGHCDYNLSENIFPFFHQDTLEYWKWVNKILETIKNAGIKFINSPYLNLNNSGFFESILSHLNFLTGGNFAQITLTSKQTKMCDEFDFSHFAECIAKNRHRLFLSKQETEEYINSFYKNSRGGMFAVTGENIYLSPQETESAKISLEKLKLPQVCISYIGGCFPVQHNILIEDIFHSRLKREAESEINVNVNFNIIRYQRYRYCFEKLIEYSKGLKNDYVIFHIRPEPYLRQVKLYYRYQDYSYKFLKTLNILFLNIFGAEKYDDLKISRNVVTRRNGRKSLLRKILPCLNYAAGCLTGNHLMAAKYIIKEVCKINKYCLSENIKFIAITPAAPHTSVMEKFLSERFSLRIEKLLSRSGINYINGSYPDTSNRDNIYFEKGSKYAAEGYHNFISKAIFEYIQKSEKSTM